MSTRFMSTLAAIAVIVLAESAVFAQSVPRAIDYQGRLTDSTGNPVADGSYDVQFSLWDVPDGGTAALWTTSPPIKVTTSGGIFTARIESVPATVFQRVDVWL